MRSPEFDLKGIGDRNHSAFARKLRRSGILSFKNENVNISFQGIDATSFLSLEDLATLAASIGRLARHGVTVNIRWPKAYQGKPSRVQKLLEGVRFLDLFSHDGGQEHWASRVVVQGRARGRAPESRPSFEHDASTAHYIPMMWIDAAALGVRITNPEDAWLAAPKLPQRANSDVRDLLHQQGFLDSVAIDALLHVLFMELGWNAILHSERQPGSGVGLFCGQVEHPSRANKLQSPKLTFCFADAGIGIPAALGEIYDRSNDSERAYHSHLAALAQLE